jgi:hypothetical protein
METPNNMAGELTEKIMNRLCGKLNPDPVLKDADTRTYNRMYSEVYSVLEKVLVGRAHTISQTAGGALPR